MSTSAICTKTIKCRNSNSCCEITVRSATRFHTFEVNAKRLRDPRRFVE